MTQFTARLKSLPRIRGGVSLHDTGEEFAEKSSPHTRGCFLLYRTARSRAAVFPAYAGVFLSVERIGLLLVSLPRIRGGVSARDF